MWSWIKQVVMRLRLEDEDEEILAYRSTKRVADRSFPVDEEWGIS